MKISRVPKTEKRDDLILSTSWNTSTTPRHMNKTTRYTFVSSDCSFSVKESFNQKRCRTVVAVHENVVVVTVEPFFLDCT